jgi:hypothetical protein
VGRVVFTDQAAAEDKNPDRLRRGLWLDHQTPVWVRVGTAQDDARFAREIELHQRALVPGVVPLLVSAAGGPEQPYLAVAGGGRPAPKVLRGRKLAATEMLPMIREGALLLRAVALAGVRLPDVELWRFLVAADGRLWLANFANATAATPEEASAHHLELAYQWSATLRRRLPQGEGVRALDAALEGAPDWQRLAQALAVVP